MSGKEMNYIQEAFDTNWVVPLGPNVNAFEDDLKKFVSSPPQPLPEGRGSADVAAQSVHTADPTQRGSADVAAQSVHTADPALYRMLEAFAKENRSNPTQAEEVLWQVLRGGKLGAKFRRQHVIDQYIVDFFCAEKGLVIELDGGYHRRSAQMVSDAERTARLEQLGYHVLRFTNEEVIGNIDGVVAKICAHQSCIDLENPSLQGGAGVGSGVGRVDREVVALSAGTAAVHLALHACGVKAGDEVLVQSFTFCASSHPVTYLGATPVFVDSEKDSWNMDPDLLEEAIKDRIAKTGRKPKAIVPVALYGMPYQIDRIMEIADRYDIPVVEDAAEGFGSRFDGRVLGTFGKYGVLSFNGNKMITTSGGGALVCADAEAKKEIMYFATQAREAYPYYQHTDIGYNYRMSNICAGIGRGQMTVADDHIAHHKHVQALYRELLAGVKGVTLHENPSDRYDSNFWLCTVTLAPDLKVVGQEHAYEVAVTGAVGGAAGVTHQAKSLHTVCEPNANVEAMRLALDKANVEARPLWKPMHKQPVYAGNPAYTNGVSEGLFRTGLCLPAGPCVTDEDVRYIVEAIKGAIE
jgi:dTDP-4-amino-4,6-dideoxygalactose transaminase/very-short-patch-repair endonuclease